MDRERELMVGSFDDYFVRAHAVHAIEHAIAFAVEAPLDAKRRKFIGHHAQRPPGRVPPAAVAPISKDFRRGLSFISRAEGTNSDSLDLNAFPHKIRRAPVPVRGNDDPASSDGVSAKFRQPCLLDVVRFLNGRT